MNARSAWAQAMGRSHGKTDDGEKEQCQGKERTAAGGATGDILGGRRHASLLSFYGPLWVDGREIA